MVKKKSSYIEPREKLPGLSDFKVYKKEISNSSPALRKQLLKERQANVQSALKQEARKKLNTATQEKIQAYNKAVEQRRANLQVQRLKQGAVSFELQQAQLQARQAQKRQHLMRLMGSRAEQLELQMLSIDEVPMLRTLETVRTRACTPPDISMNRIIKETTDFFPD